MTEKHFELMRRIDERAANEPKPILGTPGELSALVRNELAGRELHARSLDVIEVLAKFDPLPTTTLGSILVMLAEAVEGYERVVFPLDDDPPPG